MGVKTKHAVHQDGRHYGWLVRCPACKFPHNFDDRWTFNGDHEKPTFRASMLVKYDDGDPPVECVCHSYLTDGVWEYSGDCTHDLKSQRAEAPDWDAKDE